ncbi:MAG: N-acetylmuramoyl-L-alanine amidase [Alphaproteobacteria bacterium]|nr:N-acetylmuramoyl-L-alanine amidase [Alphaproteobacteria bacterium]
MQKDTINKDFNEIILHCSATAENKYFDIKDIEIWHKQQGFKSAGYHYIILLDGTIQKGRPIAEVGAHCADAGKNHSSIGICYIGGYAADGKTPKDTRTQGQKKAINTLLKNLFDKYPQLKVLSGHNRYAQKACPSFDVSKEYKYLQKELGIEI